MPREIADWSPNPEQQYNQAELKDILGKTIQGSTGQRFGRCLCYATLKVFQPRRLPRRSN